MPKLDRPRLRVDFNEMIGENLVLLARDDEKQDSSGATVALSEGARVYLYMEDAAESGASRFLLATGIVEGNTSDGWSSGVRWCCRIDRWES
jgi:hypothetical protein